MEDESSAKRLKQQDSGSGDSQNDTSTLQSKLIRNEDSEGSLNNGFAGASFSDSGSVVHVVSNDSFVMTSPDGEEGGVVNEQPLVTQGQDAASIVITQMLDSKSLPDGKQSTESGQANNQCPSSSSQQSLCSEPVKDLVAARKPEHGMLTLACCI